MLNLIKFFDVFCNIIIPSFNFPNDFKTFEEKVLSVKKNVEEKRLSQNKYLKVLNEEWNFSIIVLVNEIAKHFHKILMIKTPNFHSMNIPKD